METILSTLNWEVTGHWPKKAGGFLAEENHRTGEPLSCELTVEWLGKPDRH